MFHQALEREVGQLDATIEANDALIRALEVMRQSSPGKQVLKALKTVLRVLGEARGKGETDYLPIIVELAFLENASFMYRCYFNSIKKFPDALLEQVMAGWVSRLRGSEGKELDDVETLELISTILSVERFAAVWEDVAEIGLKRVHRALDVALRKGDGCSLDEAADKMVEKAASIGYAILVKNLPSIGDELLRPCLDRAIDVLEIVEERKVEYVLAQLVGSLGCALSGKNKAVQDVLTACFGEPSDVLDAYRAGATEIGNNEFARGLGRLGGSTRARAFVICATMAPVIYEEVSRMNSLSAFSEIFALAICAVVDADHTPFVRLYCVDALTAYLGTYLCASKEAGVAKTLMSQDTKNRVMASLALQSLASDEYIARRISDGFLRVMFEFDTHQERCVGESAGLAMHTISVCANMSPSKATFRLWDAIFQHVPASAVLARHPGFVMETIESISVNKEVRSAASLALKNVWKSLELSGTGFDGSLAANLPRCLSTVESERIVLNVADALVEAENRGDGTLESIVTYVIPGLVESCRESFLILLQRVHKNGYGQEGITDSLGACIGLLSVSKRIGCYVKFSDIDSQGIDAYEILRAAVVDSREDVQLAALELLCAGSVFTIDIPQEDELDIVWSYFNASMICTSALARQQNITCFRRLLARIKASAGATLTRPRDFDAGDHESIKRCELWIQRFCRLCIACLHPGAVYGKKMMAIELLCAAMEVFDELIAEEKPFGRKRDRIAREFPGNDKAYAGKRGNKRNKVGTGLTFGALRPFPQELYSASMREQLYGALADNFDRIRSVAMSILLMLPPCTTQSEMDVRDMLEYAFEYVRRPRLSDQDAGARMMNLIHEQFLMPGIWRIEIRSIDDFDVVRVDGKGVWSPLTFIGMLSSVATDAVPDLSSLGIGLAYLALLRHLVANASFSEEGHVGTFMSLVQLVEHTVRLILPVLSCPEENVADVEDGGDIDKDGSLADLLHSRASEEQLVRCRAWMASREICIMIQSLWLGVPSEAWGLLEQGLRRTVDALMDILLRAQHYGSIDSAKATLQCICSMRGSGPLIDDLSCACVDRLFEHMLRPDQSRRDAIRRSGGMPFGLQSVMVGSPKSRISAVITERLLGICDSDHGSTDTISGSVYWPKVHALNSLRLIFSDPRLSALDRYHSTGFKIVLQCLSDPSWEIQNSAALCFTSLVISKVMGGGAGNVRRIKHVDIWPTRALSAEGFLGRYREVDQFMIKVLQSRGTDELLAPVLALLGRLKPQFSSFGGTIEKKQPNINHEGDGGGMGISGAPIMQYKECLLRHLNSSQIHIRKMAARACVAVVPGILWHELVVESGAMLGGDHMDPGDTHHLNGLHGRLCLVAEVFKAMYSLSHYSDDIGGDLFRSISDSFCGVYGSRRLLAAMPAPCRAELLKVCTLMCRMGTKLSDKSVLGFCAEVVDGLWGAVMGQSLTASPAERTPMDTTAMKRIVKLALKWLLTAQIRENPSDSTIQLYLDWVVRLLGHDAYEVREAVLKSLLESDVLGVLQDHSTHMSDNKSVSEPLEHIFHRICASWELEPGFYAQLRMLQVTNALKRTPVGMSNVDSIAPFVRNPLLLAEILRSCSYGGRDTLAKLLPETCKPHQAEEVRAASADALAVSVSMLSTPENLDLWQVALTLMMDEDESIRSRMARAVQQAIGCGDNHGLRAEVVQERVFPWLLRRSRFSEAAVQWCLQWIVRDPLDTRAALLHCINTRSEHRLFLVEKANQHEDPLVYANMAAHSLADLPHDIDSQSLGLLLDWGAECARCLLDAMHHTGALAGSLNFGDMLGLRQNIYEDVYRLTTAVRVVAASGNAQGVQLPAVIKQIATDDAAESPRGGLELFRVKHYAAGESTSPRLGF